MILPNKPTELLLNLYNILNFGSKFAAIFEFKSISHNKGKPIVSFCILVDMHCFITHIQRNHKVHSANAYSSAYLLQDLQYCMSFLVFYERHTVINLRLWQRSTVLFRTLQRWPNNSKTLFSSLER